MPTLPEMAAMFGAGAIVKSAADSLLGRRKNRADAHKAAAEGEKAEVEADKVRIDQAKELTEIAMKLVQPLHDGLSAVTTDLQKHKEADAAARESRRRAALEHMAWDTVVVEQLRANGIEVPPPPPLFEGDDH